VSVPSFSSLLAVDLEFSSAIIRMELRVCRRWRVFFRLLFFGLPPFQVAFLRTDVQELERRPVRTSSILRYALSKVPGALLWSFAALLVDPGFFVRPSLVESATFREVTPGRCFYGHVLLYHSPPFVSCDFANTFR